MDGLPGQLRRGTPLSERQCFELAVDHLRGARDALRGLALMRGDMRWLVPVQLLDRIADNVVKLKDRGGPPLLWLANRERRR